MSGLRRAVEAHLARSSIDLDAAIAQHVGFGPGVATAQDRAQPSQQFAGLEGFGQIIIRSHFESDDAIHRVAASGEHQDRAVGPGADLPADVQAVGVRQHEIENDGICRLASMQRQAAGPVLGMDDVKARLAEVLADHVGKAGIIFDQKDTLAHDDPSIGVRSTTMPGHPWTTPRHPVRDFPALLGI